MCDICLINTAALSIESAHAELINLNAFVNEFDSEHDKHKLAIYLFLFYF